MGEEKRRGEEGRGEEGKGGEVSLQQQPVPMGPAGRQVSARPPALAKDGPAYWAIDFSNIKVN